MTTLADSTCCVEVESELSKSFVRYLRLNHNEIAALIAPRNHNSCETELNLTVALASESTGPAGPGAAAGRTRHCQGYESCTVQGPGPVTVTLHRRGPGPNPGPSATLPLPGLQ